MDFSVCVETMFADGDQPFADRIRAASAAGFPAVEIWNWRDKDATELRAALAETGTALHTICVETWQDKCRLGDPRAHAEFVRRVEETIAFATQTGTRRLVVLAGEIVDGIPIAQQRRNAVRALRIAGDVAAAAGIDLLVEVVNREFEEPHALLSDSAGALAVIEEVARENVRFLYDRYHAVLNGEPLELIDGRIDLIGHVQAADVPGRHELGTGTIDWAFEFGWLAEHGYDGLIGLETIPTRDGDASYRDAVALLPPHRISTSASSTGPAVSTEASETHPPRLSRGTWSRRRAGR